VILLRSKREIEKTRWSGGIVADIMDELEELIAPGVRTIDLDRRAGARMEKAGARGAFMTSE